jgi:hypothetical protein
VSVGAALGKGLGEGRRVRREEEMGLRESRVWAKREGGLGLGPRLRKNHAMRKQKDIVGTTSKSG